MKNANLKRTVAAALALIASPTLLLAQFEITSFTIDAGGGYSAGGSLEIEGTIGQHDAGPAAGPMIGGSFEITGGFWAMPAASCACIGDTNGDGVKNGADVQSFVNCVINGGGCTCADVDASNDITIDDIAVFVADLLSGSACP